MFIPLQSCMGELTHDNILGGKYIIWKILHILIVKDNSMAKIGIGVIGLGRMVQVYATFSASQLADANLVAVADMRADVVASFADRIGGAKTYIDYHDLLADPN